MNLNNPDLITVNKNTLMALSDARSNIDLYLIPLNEEATHYSLLVEVKSVTGDIISRGTYHSHTSGEIRRFSLITATKLIQKLLPNQHNIIIKTWIGNKEFK